MEIDVISQVAAVTRTIDSVDRDGQPTRLLVAERTYPTTVEDLWDALTTAERLPRWFLPISGDLRVGGRYQFEGQAGGEVIACEPPRRLEVTWELGDSISWLTVSLEPSGDGATLTLHHTAPVPQEMWDEFGPGAVGVGWELALVGLHLHVVSGEAVDATAFEAAEETKALMAPISEAWGEASIAAGTDPEAARAAARRTTAFYTGAEA